MYISIPQTLDGRIIEKLIPSNNIIDITCEETTGEYRYLATIVYSNLVKITLKWNAFNLSYNDDAGDPIPTKYIISSALNNAIMESVDKDIVVNVIVNGFAMPPIEFLTYEFIQAGGGTVDGGFILLEDA